MTRGRAQGLRPPQGLVSHDHPPLDRFRSAPGSRRQTTPSPSCANGRRRGLKKAQLRSGTCRGGQGAADARDAWGRGWRRGGDASPRGWDRGGGVAVRRRAGKGRCRDAGEGWPRSRAGAGPGVPTRRETWGSWTSPAHPARTPRPHARQVGRTVTLIPEAFHNVARPYLLRIACCFQCDTRSKRWP